MKSLSRNNQAGIIVAFNSTSSHLDDSLSIDYVHFEQVIDPNSVSFTILSSVDILVLCFTLLLIS